MSLTLVEVCTTFAPDDRCRELLERLRWPEGPRCLRCDGDDIRRLSHKLLWCKPCEYQFSVLAGTVFADTHLPLIKWLAAVYLLCESRKGMSANQLKRMLDTTYKTAWYLCHRIRQAMQETDPQPMTGTVEVDETYVGGRVKGKGRGPHLSGNKEIVIGIRQRGGPLRFFHVEDARSGTLERYIKEHVSGAVEFIITDDMAAYPSALDANPLFGDYRGKHRTVNHSSGVYVEGDVHTNSVESAFSLLKRGIMGTWHKISAKHLIRYLNEMCFRFDRRDDEEIFLETLRYMVSTDPLRYKELVK